MTVDKLLQKGQKTTIINRFLVRPLEYMQWKWGDPPKHSVGLTINHVETSHRDSPGGDNKCSNCVEDSTATGWVYSRTCDTYQDWDHDVALDWHRYIGNSYYNGPATVQKNFINATPVHQGQRNSFLFWKVADWTRTWKVAAVSIPKIINSYWLA